MAETISTLSVISFAAAGVFLALSIFLFFFFRIPTVIGDLSGITARKSIAKMRAVNEKTGIKSYKASKVNIERGKLTGTIPDLNKHDKKKVESGTIRPETSLLAENQADKIEVEATGVLDDETTEIIDTEDTGLLIDEEVTAPLDTSEQKLIKHKEGKKLTMLDEVMIINTDEVIK